jgi:hypothetical protein
MHGIAEMNQAGYKTRKYPWIYSLTTGEAYIVYTKDVMVRDGVTHIPAYMAMFL